MYRHRVLITEQQIQQRVQELAEVLNKEYRNETLDIICVLKGATFFVTDIMRQLSGSVRLHFLQVSSYGTGTESSGTVHLHFSSILDLEDKHVLLVEDVLDTGVTMDYVVKHFQEQKPRSLKTCVLLDKPEKRKVNITADYVGFQIPDEFVIGYGLDYAELGRNLKYVAVLDSSEFGRR